jgi:hypothetical protein
MNLFNPKQKYHISPEDTYDIKPLRKYELILKFFNLFLMVASRQKQEETMYRETGIS